MPADTPDDLRNLEETAQFFSVSVPTLRAWIRKGCPVFAGGSNGVAYRLSLTAVKEWRDDEDDAESAEAERKAQQNASLQLELLGGTQVDLGDGPGHLSPVQQNAALQAEIARTKLAAMRRKLVDADAIQLALASVFVTVGQHLDALPQQLGDLLGWDDDQVDACRDALEGCRDEFADASAKFDVRVIGGVDLT